MQIVNIALKLTTLANGANRARGALFVVIALSIALSACSRREYRVKEHDEGRVSESAVQNEQGSAARDEVSSRLSTPEIDAGSLADRSRAFFTESRLLKPELVNSQQTADELGRINRSILAAIESKQTNAESVSTTLGAYKRALLLGCAEASLNGCHGYRVFQRDPDSLRVVLALAHREKDIRESYRLLRIAYTLQGRTVATDLDGAYLSRALTYYKTLTPGSAAAREHLEIVQQIVSRLNRATTQAFDAKWLQEFEPWNFQRTRLPEMAAIDEQVLQLALRLGIYESRESGKLTPAFQTAMESMARESTGLLAKLETVKKERPELLRGLNLKSDTPLDEYFFIFEGLFTEKISTTDATMIWQATRQEVARAQAELLVYMRLRLAIIVHETNSSFQRFMVSNGQFTSGSVIVAALEHGTKLSQSWAVGLNRFAALKTIADRHLRDSSSASSDIEAFSLGLERNVKFLATYPNMFIVAYHLARLNFSTRHFIGGRVMDLNAATVFQGLFEGKWQPWFEFSRDMSPLSAPEVLLAFHFALKTGAFQGAGITLDGFFRVLIDKLIGADHQDLKNAIANVQNGLEGDQNVRAFTQVCGQIQKTSRGSRLPSVSMPLASLSDFAFLGVPSRTTSHPTSGAGTTSKPASPLLQSVWQFYEFDKKSLKLTKDLVEQATYSFAPRVEFIRLLVSLLETHLKETQASNVDATLANILSTLAPYERTKVIANTTLLHYHRRFSSCIDRMTWAEIDSRTYLVHSFVQHLRDVHAAMSQDAAAGNGLNGRFHLSGPAGLQIEGLDRHEASLGFNKNLYRFSKLQLLLRFAMSLERGFQTAQGKIEPVRGAGSFILPRSIAELDASMTTMTIDLPFEADLGAFISNGLRALLGNVNLVQWPNDDEMLGGLTTRIDVLKNLAKSGELEVCDPSSSGCSATKKDRLSMKELVETQIESLRMVELDETWMGFLRSAGLNNRFRVKRPAYITDLVVDMTDNSVLGLLDSTFRGLYIRISANSEGAPTDAKDSVAEKRIDPLDKAEQYFTAARSMGSSSFEISPSYNELLKQFYGSAADQAMIRTAEFVREAQAIAKSGNKVPNWNHYVTRRYPESIPVLTPGLVDEFRSRALNFSRRTQRQLPKEVSSVTGH